MKQLNVRDETHKLARELSLRTGVSLLVVVQEALEMYAGQLEGLEAEDKLLQKAAVVIDERMCKVVHEEVPHAMDEIRRLQAEAQKQRVAEIEQILRETTPEAPEDDLEVIQYEKVYGAGSPLDTGAESAGGS